MAGLLVVNANIWGWEDADSLLVEDDKIVAVGREDRLRRIARPCVEIFDAGGKLVIPGLTDAHMHLLSYARTKEWIDLKGAKSIDEIKRLVKSKAADKRPGEWILGRGWDQDKLDEKRMPTRWDLDEVAPNNPVLLVRVCGHVAVVNSRALKVMGLTDESPDPPDGVLGREGGRLNGRLYEGAVELAYSSIPGPSLEKAASLIREVLREVASYGLVELHSMSATNFEVEAYRKAYSPELPRVYFYAESFDVKGGEVIGLKTFMDGSFGARTARLREPYSDAPSTRGLLLLSAEKLEALISKASERGWQVAVHAIGDEAVEKVLEVSNHRPLRVEHASLTPPDLVEKLAELDVPVSVQPHFIASDTWIVDRLGERARWVYAYKTLLRRGVRIAGSSDAPVEPIDPWTGVYAAVDRGRSLSLPIWSASPGEALSVSEALNLYLYGPVLRGGVPRELSPGATADFAVLNVYDISEICTRPMCSVLTVIGGLIAHKG